MNEELKNPKVFISYSWSSSTHQKFVLEIAEKLSSDGVIVIIDKWELKEGQDKYAFMEKMVTDPTVNKVLIFTDKNYVEKADNKTGGVGTESQIISSEIYDKVEQTKFIPIVTEFDADDKAYLPVFLKNRIYVNFGENFVFYDEYDKLLRNIYDKPIYKKPALGSPPAHLFTENQDTLVTQHKYSQFKNSLINDKPATKLFLEEYFNEFLIAVSSFKLPKETSNKNLDDQVYDAIHSMKVYRDELFKVYKDIVTVSNDFVFYEIIFEFLEKLLRLNFPPENVNSYSEWWYEHLRFFSMENFIYLIAILIKYKKFDEVNFFTEEKYSISTGYEKGTHEFISFNFYIKSIDEYRNNRLKLNRISIIADLIKERFDLSYLTFEEIMQADFILALKSTFDKKEGYFHWYPKTLVYKHSNQPFPLFIKAESKRYFEVISKLFYVDNRDGLIKKFDQASTLFNFQKWRLDYRSIQFKTLLNLEKLYKS